MGSGLFSGLNLGLMSLEPNELKRKAKLGDKRAEKLYPLRKRGNLLLVTLLLSNMAFNSALAIFLGTVTFGILAGVLSTALLTVFGEILPQAVISRFALSFGARTAWFVKFMLTVLSPICKPIAWVLDKTLGEELPTTYSRKELIQILEEHGDSQKSDIKRDEERIASGALSFGARTVKDVMTPRSVVVGLESGQVLNKATVDTLVKHGYSRFPVTDKTGNRAVGILYAYKLIGSRLDKKVDDVCSHEVHYLNENESLDRALNAFIKTKQHLFIVVNQFSEYLGIVTIEDVLEEIIGLEIVDEFDEYTDLRKVAEKFAKKQL
jgi:metal transporter CNNM